MNAVNLQLRQCRTGNLMSYVRHKIGNIYKNCIISYVITYVIFSLKNSTNETFTSTGSRQEGV
jgi:hypothetical protein